MSTATKQRAVRTTDYEAVNRMIEEAEGRATARYLDCRHIDAAVVEAERMLAPLPKRLWAGVTVTVDPHRVPNAYSWAAESTKATLVRRSRDWELVLVWRGRAQSVSGGVNARYATRVALPVDVDRADLLASMLRTAHLEIAQ